MKRLLSVRALRPLLCATLLAIVSVNLGSAASATGACLVLVEQTSHAHFENHGCLTSLTGPAVFQAQWALTDPNWRPVSVTLNAAAGQTVTAALFIPGDSEPVATLESSGASADAKWPLQPSDYELEFIVSGAEGRFTFATEAAGSRVSFSSSASGPDSRRERLRGEFERIGSLEGSPDYVEWQVQDDSAEAFWRLQLQGTAGHPVTLKIYDDEGTELLHESLQAGEMLHRTGLSFPAGTNTLVLSPAGESAHAGYHVSMTSVGPEAHGQKRADSGSYATAHRIDLGTGVTGRLEADSQDYFLLSVSEDEAGLFDLRLDASDGIRSLCLDDSDRSQLACWEVESETLSVGNLRLETGGYWFRIAGQRDSEPEYTLSFSSADEPAADNVVTSPSGSLATAFRLPGSLSARITHGGRTKTFLAFEVPESGLYRVQLQANGDLRSVDILDGGGGTIRSDRQLRFDNIPLRVGLNHVAVDAREGEYALRILRLADMPPTPSAQPAAPAQTVPAPDSMPSDFGDAVVEARPPGVVVPGTVAHSSGAMVLRAGEDHVGLIDGPDAHFRFTLLSDSSVRLTLSPPGDGTMRLRLNPSAAADRTTSAPGEEARLDQWLPAGDYQVEVRMTNDSEGWYRLRLDHLDPLNLPTGLGPLDPANAAELPADLNLRTRPSADDMFFRLPVAPQDTVVQVHVASGSLQHVWIHPVPDTRRGTRLDRLEQDAEAGTFTVQVEADTEYHVVLESAGQDDWDVSFAFGAGISATHMADPHELPELGLSLETTSVTAWSRLGQEVSGSLSISGMAGTDGEFDVTVHASDPRAVVTGLPETMALEAGEDARVPFSLLLPDDLRSDRPFVLTVGLRNASGQTVTASGELVPTCEAPPVGARVWTPEPFASLSYWNHALPAWGATLAAKPSNRTDGLITDGRISVTQPAQVEPGKEYHLDLGREVTIRATALHSVGDGNAQTRLRDFELAVSADGGDWTTVLNGSMTGAPIEQLFSLDEPVTARHVRLRVISNQARSGRISLGEWKVLGLEQPAERLNLADPQLGGHIVRSSIWAGMTEPLQGPADGPGDARPGVSLREGDPPFEMVVAFHENRAALIDSFEWQDYPRRTDRTQYAESVSVYVSTDSPLGPWQHAAEWDLERDGGQDIEQPGVRTMLLDEPVWARYVRIVETGARTAESRSLNLPSPLRIFEHQADDAYRSILSEWGMGRSVAAYEHASQTGVELAGMTFGSNGSPETAAALEAGSSGFVQTGVFEAWYAVTVPENMNELVIGVSSVASVGVTITVLDPDGEETATGLSGAPLRVPVDPGTYLVRLTEPPRSIAFVWDNSGSVSRFSAMTYAALDAFAASINPELEDVMLAAFSATGARFLLPTWSSSAVEVVTALNTYDRSDGSSDAGSALIETSRLFADRQGSRALILITDAEFSFGNTPEVWDSIARAGVQVHSLHVSSASTFESQAYMQDLGHGTGGHYAATPTFAHLETGFARADCLIRGPKPYLIEATLAERELRPGLLSVSGTRSEEAEGEPDAAGGAIQVILDSSGSMWQTLDGRHRFEIARDVLVDLVGNVLPERIPFALRVFGNREANVCRTDLEVSLSPLERTSVAAVISGIEPQPFAGTPLAASILLASQDMTDAAEPRTLILITDGEESCDGDVEAAIAELRSTGVDVVLNIIGFDFDATDTEAARERFRSWAELGGGEYFDATDAKELADALQRSVAPGFDVLDESGDMVARGTVDGPALELAGGTYTIRIHTSPVQEIPDVRVDEGTTRIELDPPSEGGDQ